MDSVLERDCMIGMSIIVDGGETLWIMCMATLILARSCGRWFATCLPIHDNSMSCYVRVASMTFISPMC
jgi:hypothetical protein